MAITVLKKTPIHCVVMVNTVGTNTITLATDLLWSNAQQHEFATTPDVRISGITWSVPVGNAVVARNSVDNWILTLSNKMMFDGWYDTLNSTHDIAVTIPAGGGTVVLELLKYSGYGNTQHLNDTI